MTSQEIHTDLLHRLNMWALTLRDSTLTDDHILSKTHQILEEYREMGEITGFSGLKVSYGGYRWDVKVSISVPVEIETIPISFEVTCNA